MFVIFQRTITNMPNKLEALVNLTGILILLKFSYYRYVLCMSINSTYFTLNFTIYRNIKYGQYFLCVLDLDLSYNDLPRGKLHLHIIDGVRKASDVHVADHGE